MENDTQFIPANDNTSDKPGGSKAKIVILGFVGIIAIVALSGLFFYLGKNSHNKPSSDEQIVTVSDTPTQAPTETPSPTASDDKLTPTKKVTPSPTPKNTATPTVTPSPSPKTKIITSTPALDGFESSNNGGNTTNDIRAGRNMYLVSRGFVSFDLSGLPTGVNVTKATLRLYQTKADEGTPYSNLGSLKIDHLTYGDTLDNSDYGMAALSSSFATLTTNPTIEWKDAEVTDSVKNDLQNGNSRSQYRIHFQVETTGSDATGDFAHFESGEKLTTQNAPELVINYY